MTKSLVENLWIILTVLIPSIIFYTIFRVLTLVLEINIPLLKYIETSDTLFIGIIITLGFIIQLFGIATESLIFKIGYCVYKKPEYKKAFKDKYKIIATMDSDKGCNIERIVAQLFMSHNIAVGMLINFSWTCIYILLVQRFDSIAIVVVVVLAIITMVSMYVPINRFNQTCEVLHSYSSKHYI
ncbi:hypothetical protein [Methanococcoides sp. LMO-2]|uniref:ABC transmembrane type-1 domain-containing protein n=1 Tax=Methanococcoides cohabitans TaxID=3136559 RepID=A0ABU9KYR3_9EURY